jgi:hypothetical protein
MTGLRRILGDEKGKVTVEWRNSHEEFRDLYSSFSIIRLIKLSSDARVYGTHRRDYKCLQNYVRKS